MIVLSCTNISKTYIAQKILDNISFSLNANEKAGLIGINGAGKTTLLNILTDNISSDTGQVHVSKTSKIGYLRQNVNITSDNSLYDELLEIFKPIIDMEQKIRDLEHEISNISQNNPDDTRLPKLMDRYAVLSEDFADKNGYGYQSEIKGVLIGLGFLPEEFSRSINELSGGQKTRILLAKLLLTKPDILLLDEPTNHLDLKSIEWLEKFLKDYKGAVIIISHDRYFLDNVVSKIFELENTKLKTYNGNYSTYMDKRKKELEILRKKYEQQRLELKRQKDIIKNLSLGGKRAIRQAKSREKLLKKMDEIKQPSSDRKKAHISFTPSIKSGNDVLALRDVKKSFNNTLIFENVNFDIYSGEKVGIIGPNGIGKSTLFKMIMKMMSYDDGTIKIGHNVEIGYFDQEMTNLNPEKTVMDEIWDEHPTFDHFEVRSLLARFLFTGDDIFKIIDTLSGGEKGRLSLLKLMLSKANFILADEPTNHLDVDSKEVLEDSLLKYEGTVLVISHDRYFLNKVVDKILYFDSTGMTEYLGNFDYYVEKKKLQENADKDEYEPSQTKTQIKYDRKKKKQLEKEERAKRQQLKKLEETIATLEEKINEYEQLLCTPDVYSDPIKSSQVNQKLVEVKLDLENSYDEWVMLSS